ncbi:hypothetical protein RFI_04885 [Reticulomyxa filosa]|uniref:PCI domain-containing protein n=1 Tax=Reticulomyxa filosa TaxID=46433 RepID=X6P3S9_RETFI|nr:hypothetical protein RFI_04885 [Reticulomyxa filosa]|eukprot:ETO32232.1 hypothetical protein RFI_04885 [Reticulomyxa filosa]
MTEKKEEVFLKNLQRLIEHIAHDNNKKKQLKQIKLKQSKTNNINNRGCIQQALRLPGLYTFGEIMEHEHAKALKGTQQGEWYNVLELFASGTYEQYKANSSKYPKLDEKQLFKLKQLSVVSLAEKSASKVLNYNDLMTRLDIGTVRELEDVIINCIYEGLVHGRLNQSKNQLEIDYVSGRDINAAQISGSVP